ncbi:hypothetical protein ACFFP0_26935 [Rhizobium puerariae]|uniref:Uncharacterized protein n=1 Tax=Rhizobium puerariae TaxID=1585791 RepID=A0ABV6AT61_9HYPH
MEIGGIGRDQWTRFAKTDTSSTSENTDTASAEQKGPAEEQYDRLVHGLTSLNEATDAADEEAKARAKKKLDEAKQQLQFLQRWGFDPEVIARQAAMLGVVVAAAAREFSDAVTGGSTAATNLTAGAAQSSGTGDADASDGGTQAAAEGTADGNRSYSQAEQAYRDVMDGDTSSSQPKLSSGDIRTATEFSAVARQIKALLEQAARRLREEKDGLATVPDTRSLDTAVNALSGTVSSMPAVSITI